MDGIGLFVGIGLMVVLIQWAKKGFPAIRVVESGGSRRIPVAYRMDSEQRKAALEAYKHAVSEKMDVMRAAIQMGWRDEELKQLDARLEQLIGEAELKRLLNGEMSEQSGAEGMSPQDEYEKLLSRPRRQTVAS